MVFISSNLLLFALYSKSVCAYSLFSIILRQWFFLEIYFSRNRKFHSTKQFYFRSIVLSVRFIQFQGKLKLKKKLEDQLKFLQSNETPYELLRYVYLWSQKVSVVNIFSIIEFFVCPELIQNPEVIEQKNLLIWDSWFRENSAKRKRIIPGCG